MPTYPLTWPSQAKIVSSTFSLVPHQTVFPAIVSGALGVAELNEGKTDRWQGSYTLAPAGFVEGSQFLAFLLSLKGGQGTFYAFDPDRRTPLTKSGSFPGNGLVQGGGQTGRSLLTNGWPASALILKPGDLIQVGEQVLEVDQEITTDGSGVATLTFQPALRLRPNDADPVITDNPVFIARIKEKTPSTNSGITHTNANTIIFEEVL